MKAYLITTGTVFGLITVAHIARLLTENGFAADPVFVLLTGLTAGLCTWAFVLLKRPRGA